MPKKALKRYEETYSAEAAPLRPHRSLEAVSEVCRESGCDSLATTEHYCRAHYIKNWTKIKEKQELLRDGRFQKFIEELVKRYPDQILRAIRNDLSTVEEFERVCDSLGLREGLSDIISNDTDSIDEA